VERGVHIAFYLTKKPAGFKLTYSGDVDFSLVPGLKHGNQVLSLLRVAGREKSIGRSCAI